jgi:hypothetical protein
LWASAQFSKIPITNGFKNINVACAHMLISVRLYAMYVLFSIQKKIIDEILAA